MNFISKILSMIIILIILTFINKDKNESSYEFTVLTFATPLCSMFLFIIILIDEKSVSSNRTFYEEYFCDVDMDEDDYSRLVERGYKECPYYKDGDEYKVVRHQI